MGAAMRRYLEEEEIARKKTVTPLTHAERVIFCVPPSNYCPFCRCTAIVFDHYEGDKNNHNEIRIVKRCLQNACKKHWTNVYTLTDVFAS